VNRHRAGLAKIWIVAAFAGLLAVALVTHGTNQLMAAATTTPKPTATPVCPRVTDTEVAQGTPAALGTPVVFAICEATGLRTPVPAADLSVTLTAAQTKAGPVDLTVEIVDADGKPVDDATVLVLNQHLEMNHGVSVSEAVHTKSGRYVATKVPMGMGGHWQVEVQITRPDRPMVAAVFEVKLSGPM
jgi:YtkA-like